MLYSILLMPGIVACLLLAGCKEDKPVDHSSQGFAYAHTGQYDRAISEFTKAINSDPMSPEPYYNRGLAYYHKGEYDRAIEDCNKVLEINARHAEAYNNRGNAYANKGEY
ncbi:MAG: tetratricopeptide repeat protein, partial [Sedimentisphaerales bacterium]